MFFGDHDLVAGAWLNLVGVALVSGFVYFLLPRVWGFSLMDGTGFIP